MKTDSELQFDVTDELTWDPSVDHERIGVSVTAGVVTLSGIVGSYAEKILAEKTARRVKGVRAVADELEVRYDWQPKTSDSEIAKRIADILEWDPLVPRDRISITVNEGAVKLEGRVDWNYQRDLAFEDAGKITGVVRVDNWLEVVPPVSTSDIRGRIERAFERSADLEAEKIHVEGDGSKVTLTGSVTSWNKRNLAEHSAWAAPGVTHIEDKLVVA